MLVKKSFIINDKTRKDSVTNQYNNLAIITPNVNELFDDSNRQQVFQFLENKNAEIILLQETYSNPDISGLYIIQKLEKQWKCKSFWNSGNKEKHSGVAIKENTEQEPIMTKQDEECEILFLTLIFEKQLLQVVNIYVPTNPPPRKSSYKNLKNYKKTQNNLILAGYFNMDEDLSVDRQGGSVSEVCGRKYLHRLSGLKYVLTHFPRQPLHKIIIVILG